MGYNIANFRRVQAQIDERRRNAIGEADLHTAELHAKSAEVKEIDTALRSLGMRLFREALAGGDDLNDRLERIRTEHENLRGVRAEILIGMGYPADYSEPHFSCTACQDTGFIRTEMCDCMKKSLVEEGIRSSGIGKLYGRQSFDNFTLDYYREPLDRERARYALGRTRQYAEGFGPQSGNLLLIGPTGLGKTHLSTSVARTVIERGYDVVYETIQNILADFEYDRFKSGYGETQSRSERYLACELLIIDDLGTEQVTPFVLATLYHLLNTRLNHGKQTVINTNVSGEELQSRYENRITSRLLGEYEILLFSGNDIRMQKL